MEISLVDGGLNQFPDANLMTRLIHLYSDLSSSIWTLAALFLTAAAAAFSGTIKTTVLIFLRRRKGRSIMPHPSSEEEDDDDDSCSCSSSSDDSDEEEEELKVESEEEDIDSCWQEDRDGKSEDCPFWPEIGGAVVKAWDELGLGFQRSGSSGSISLFDLNRGEVLRSFLAGKGQIPAVSLTSPAVVLSAAAGEREGTTAVKVWDTRGEWQDPAAEWLPVLRRRVVGIAGGDKGMAYINDEPGSVTAVDLRRARSPPVEMWYAAVNGNDKEVVREKEVVRWRNGRRGSLATRLSLLSFLPLYE